MSVRRGDVDFVLLYDGTCAPCTDLGRQVAALGVPNLYALGFADPQIVETYGDLAARFPDRPVLLRQDRDGTRFLTGVAMRVSLVRLIGPRQVRTLVRLAAAELSARRSQRTEQPHDPPHHDADDRQRDQDRADDEG